MSDEALPLKKEWSTDGKWYKWKDTRSVEERKAKESRTIHRWYYGDDDDLELRFETDPVRGWGIWHKDKRVGFVAEINPEPTLGDSIRAAKREAVDWLQRISPVR